MQENRSYLEIKVLLAILVTGIVVWGLKDVAALLIISLVVAFVLDPVVLWVKRDRLSRGFAVSIVYFALLGIAAIISVLVVPDLVSEIRSFAKNLPEYLRQLREGFSFYTERFAQDYLQKSVDVDEYIDDSVDTLKDGENFSAAKVGFEFLSSGFGFVSSYFNLILLPFLSFYLLWIYDEVKDFPKLLCPKKYHSGLEKDLKSAERIFAGYLRGMGSVAIILSVYYAATLSIAGVPYAFVIGLVTGALTFIPAAGPTFGLLASSAVLIFDGFDLYKFIFVLVIFGVAEVLEALVITPRVVGDRVGIHPLLAILLVVIGGTLFGPMGLFLGIPVGTLIWRIYARRVLKKRKS